MEWSRENVVEAVLLRQAALRDVGPVEDETVEATPNQMIEQSGGRSILRADGFAGGSAEAD